MRPACTRARGPTLGEPQARRPDAFDRLLRPCRPWRGGGACEAYAPQAPPMRQFEFLNISANRSAGDGFRLQARRSLSERGHWPLASGRGRCGSIRGSACNDLDGPTVTSRISSRSLPREQMVPPPSAVSRTCWSFRIVHLSGRDGHAGLPGSTCPAQDSSSDRPDRLCHGRSEVGGCASLFFLRRSEGQEATGQWCAARGAIGRPDGTIRNQNTNGQARACRASIIWSRRVSPWRRSAGDPTGIGLLASRRACGTPSPSPGRS